MPRREAERCRVELAQYPHKIGCGAVEMRNTAAKNEKTEGMGRFFRVTGARAEGMAFIHGFALGCWRNYTTLTAIRADTGVRYKRSDTGCATWLESGPVSWAKNEAAGIMVPIRLHRVARAPRLGRRRLACGYQNRAGHATRYDGPGASLAGKKARGQHQRDA